MIVAVATEELLPPIFAYSKAASDTYLNFPAQTFQIPIDVFRASRLLYAHLHNRLNKFVDILQGKLFTRHYETDAN